MDSTTAWGAVPHQSGREVEGHEARSIYQVPARVTDNRRARGKRYDAGLVLTLVLLAKMAGEQTLSGIAEWVRLRQVQLSEWLPLTRTPCANTYRYICEQIDAQQLNDCLAALFMRPVADEIAADPPAADPPAVTLRHLACDGKTLRGNQRLTAQGVQEAQSVLGVYDVASGHMEALLPIEGKGHEPKAFLQWLKTQAAGKQREGALQGCLLTADALHTQSAVCKAIRRTGADYLLIAKRNQRQLHADIDYLFSQAPDFWFPERQGQRVNSGHGRIEVRRIRVSSELNDYLADRWPHVQQVFRLERTVTRRSRQGDKSTVELVYGLTSLSPHQAAPHQLIDSLQAHWKIENRNHWRRDVTLGEDRMQLSSKTAAFVMAVLNCALLALFDRLHITNAARALRTFDAFPAHALTLLRSPL